MKILEYGLFRKAGGVRHCVTMRDPAKTLDFSLALHTGQAAEAIRANRRELERFFGRKGRFVSVLQVHGEEVYIVENTEEHGWLEVDDSVRADALLTALPGTVLTILTADCVPILLYDPVRRVIGAVHAGWKGSRLGIAAKTVRKMGERFGSRPGEVLAAIGPAIGGCCYEVGPEVAEHFRGYEGAVIPSATGGNPRLDLKAVNRRQLLDAGVLPEHIETSPVCTACEHERFFSYRREGGCDGRFMSCIMIES
jgi:YfiH family protein